MHMRDGIVAEDWFLSCAFYSRSDPMTSRSTATNQLKLSTRQLLFQHRRHHPPTHLLLRHRRLRDAWNTQQLRQKSDCWVALNQ